MLYVTLSLPAASLSVVRRIDSNSCKVNGGDGFVFWARGVLVGFGFMAWRESFTSIRLHRSCLREGADGGEVNAFVKRLTFFHVSESGVDGESDSQNMRKQPVFFSLSNLRHFALSFLAAIKFSIVSLDLYILTASALASNASEQLLSHQGCIGTCFFFCLFSF